MQKAKNGYLLYNKASNITARAFAEVMNLIPIRDYQNARRFGLHNVPPIIRYGNSDGKVINDTNFNSPDVIKLCADSLAFSRWCEEKGIYSPRYRHFNRIAPPDYPFLLRDRWHHGGLDINIVKNQRDIQILPWDDLEGRFAVDVIPTDYELRVHIVDGDAIRVFIKRPTEVVKEGDFIRSHYKGWRYSLCDSENKYKKAQALCEDVAHKLGLKFGGFDIAWDAERGEYVIWEVNSAPGLNYNTLMEYTNKIKDILHVR